MDFYFSLFLKTLDSNVGISKFQNSSSDTGNLWIHWSISEFYMLLSLRFLFKCGYLKNPKKTQIQIFRTEWCQNYTDSNQNSMFLKIIKSRYLKIPKFKFRYTVHWHLSNHWLFLTKTPCFVPGKSRFKCGCLKIPKLQVQIYSLTC